MVEQSRINQYVDDLKQIGYRPTLVCVLIAKRKIGLLKGRNYNGYEFVQGGIEYGESPEDTLGREVMEELGYWFYYECNFPNVCPKFLFEDKMDMKMKDMLQTMNGEKIHPKGKHYIIFFAELTPRNDKLPSVNEDDLHFEGSQVKLQECKWVDTKEAIRLMEKVKNPIKRKMALKVIRLIHDRNLVD